MKCIRTIKFLLGAVQKSADIIWELHICFIQNVTPESSSHLCRPMIYPLPFKVSKVAADFLTAPYLIDKSE